MVSLPSMPHTACRYPSWSHWLHLEMFLEEPEIRVSPTADRQVGEGREGFLASSLQ